MRSPQRSAAAVICASLALLIAMPAHADVKAGVDAWSAGDFTRAIAEWRAPAAKGDADAMFNLAQAYRLGRGVPQDLQQAETLYARAAAKGHLKAADNYGLLLFQDGRRDQAMPYVTAAAERGDPRAQYLLGIAHFNGDFVVKDWVRAYALLTLANGAGLPQAGPAISEMDGFIPLAQRQQAQVLAGELRVRADVRRSAQMAALDLGDGPTLAAEAPVRVAAAAAPATLPPPGAPDPIAAVRVSAAEAAVAEAMRATGIESPADAGADFARPAQAARPPRAEIVSRVARADPPAPPKASAAATGQWKVQLGAFSVPGNADRLWSQLAGKPALTGKTKLVVPAGRLTRLLAGGWSSESAARSACNALKAAGQGCLVTR